MELTFLWDVKPVCKIIIIIIIIITRCQIMMKAIKKTNLVKI